MTKSLIAGLAGALLSTVTALAASTSTVPAYISAAVADKGRPAADKARDADRKPAEVLAFASVKPGDQVVELIPGKGYFTRLLAKAVGPAGHVYAYYPTELDATMKAHNVAMPTSDPAYPNVSIVHASINAINAPEGANVVWTSQNYHDLHDKFFGPANLAVVNGAIYNSLKPGGVYIVLDHAAAPGSGLRDTETLHRIDEAAVKSEVEAGGFTLAGESDLLRNSADMHDKPVFDPSIRGHTDQFVLKFVKPDK